MINQPQVAPAGATGRLERGVLIGCVALGVVLRLRQYAAGRSMWLDEVLLARGLVDVPFPEVLTQRLPNGQSAPPGYVFVAKVVVELFGSSEQALRLVALVAGIATLAIAVVVARRLLDHPVARVGFVVLVAMSPPLIYYANEVKQYSLDVLAMMTVLVLWSVRTTRQWPVWLGLGGLAIAVMSVPGMFGLGALALAMATEQVVDHRRQWRAGKAPDGHAMHRTWRNWLTMAGLWAVGVGVHALYTLQSGVNRSFMVEWWTAADAFPPDGITSVGDLGWYPMWLIRLGWIGIGAAGRVGPIAPIFSPVLGLAVMAAVGFLVAAALWCRRDLRALFGFLLLIALLAAQARIYPTSGRLSLYLVPFVLMAVAAGLGAVMAQRRDVVKVVAMGAVGVLVTVQAATTMPLFFQPLNDYDARSAIAAVEAGYQPGDAIVIERWAAAPEFYLRTSTIPGVPVVVLRLDEVAADGFPDSAALASYQRLWLVGTHRTFDSRRLAALFDAQGEFVVVCDRTLARQTYLALLVRRDLVSDVDPAVACPTR